MTAPRWLDKRLQWGAGSKLAAEVVGRALQFVLIYVAQRMLGPSAYGEFTYALAVGFVLAPLTDLGIQLIITREIARDPHSESVQRAGRSDTYAAGREPSRQAIQTASAGLTLKIVLASLVAIAIGVVSTTRSGGAQIATFALASGVLLGTFVEFFGYTFRGFQHVEHEALLNLLARAITVAVGVWMLWLGLGLRGVAIGYLAGNGLGALAGYLWLRHRFFVPQFTVDLGRWATLLRQTLPLGGAIVLSIAYTRTPVFLLDAMSGSAAVGLYGVAQKLTEPFAILPAALMAAVFPAVARGLSRHTPESDSLRTRSVQLLALAGGAISAGLALAAPWVLNILYGHQYDGSEAALRTLALTVALTFVNYALTHFLIALDRQKLNLIFNAVIFVLNLMLCLALIPRFGPAGAAVAVLASEAVLLLLCWRALARIPEQRSALIAGESVR